jgi:hypothetical protein
VCFGERGAGGINTLGAVSLPVLIAFAAVVAIEIDRGLDKTMRALTDNRAFDFNWGEKSGGFFLERLGASKTPLRHAHTTQTNQKKSNPVYSPVDTTAFNTRLGLKGSE